MLHYVQGKTWIDKVRKCLTETVAPLYGGEHDCDAIKRTAFDSQVACYTNSGNGFCDMVAQESNWNALYEVFDPAHATEIESISAWPQVLSSVSLIVAEDVNNARLYDTCIVDVSCSESIINATRRLVYGNISTG